jgi:thiol-disulfide isomerase/thioredoxin
MKNRVRNGHRNNRTLNKNKQIIGKIYANWCGHCKALKVEWPKFKNLVESKGISHIDFVEMEESEKNKIDAFKREHGIEVSGYPTIFRMTPATSNKPIHTTPSLNLQLGGQNNKSQNNHGQKYHIEYYNGVRDAETLANWALNQPQNQEQKGGKTNKRKNKTNKRKNNRTRRVAKQ